jgi:MFS family permease
MPPSPDSRASLARGPRCSLRARRRKERPIPPPPTERRTVRANLRELPSAAWFLIGGNFINWFASFAVVFLVLYLTRRGFGLAAAGAAVATYGAGELCAGFVGGYLADRLGRRTTIALSMFSSAASLLGLYVVHPYAGILVLAAVAGVSAETFRPAGRALMADLVPEGRRVTAFAAVRFAGSLGFAGGSAVAGFLANHSFLWVFLSDAATSVVFGVIALSLLPQGTRVSRADEGRARGYREMVRDRVFLLFLMASVMISFVYFQTNATLPLHVVRVAHLEPSAFGLLLTINSLLVVALEIPISSVTMRLAPTRVIAVGFLLFGVGFGLTAFARSFVLLVPTVVVWTFGEMIAAPVGYAYVADIAPAHMRGRYQGIYGLSWGLGSVTGPALGTFLFATSVDGLWALCAALGVASAAIVLGGRPVPPRTNVELPLARGEPTPQTVA